MRSIRAVCENCNFSVPYRPNDISWAIKNQLCLNCAKHNCMDFDREFPFGIENSKFFYQDTWEELWLRKPFKWNWLKFKWEEVVNE